MRKVKIIQDEDPAKQVSHEILAQAIVEVSEAAKKLLSTRLTERTVVLLIHNSIPAGSYKNSRPSMKQITQVLEAAEGLESKFLKPKPKREPYQRS